MKGADHQTEGLGSLGLFCSLFVCSYACLLFFCLECFVFCCLILVLFSCQVYQFFEVLKCCGSSVIVPTN